jgi:uncharacterized protein (TIGR00730 family)
MSEATVPFAVTALEQRVATIRASSTYRLAEQDPDFMESESARASRLSLEFMRADVYLREHRINSTVVVFGGARILAPETARARLAALGQQAPSAVTPRQLARARSALAYSRFYDEARALGAALPERDPVRHCHDFVIATGGGPGIMEAANRGAFEAGAPTIGFNIHLPSDQAPNPYVTPSLAFQFHYFAIRKMHFLLRARALVAFPGGYGTLDELFESLNLVQTEVIQPIPIVLVGREHWRSVVNFDHLVEHGFISEHERELITFVDTGLEAAELIRKFHACPQDHP